MRKPVLLFISMAAVLLLGGGMASAQTCAASTNVRFCAAGSEMTCYDTISIPTAAYIGTLRNSRWTNDRVVIRVTSPVGGSTYYLKHRTSGAWYTQTLNNPIILCADGNSSTIEVVSKRLSFGDPCPNCTFDLDPIVYGTQAITIDGMGGDDVLIGGAGKDILYGNLGNDRLIGSRDWFNSGTDYLYGGPGNDELIQFGSAGTVRGLENDDYLYAFDRPADGGSGNDMCLVSTPSSCERANCTFPSSFKKYTSNNGSATYYDPRLAGQPSCGFSMTGAGGAGGAGGSAGGAGGKVVMPEPVTVAFVETGSGEYFATLSSSDFAAGAGCGACVKVTRTEAGGAVVKTVVATVVGECSASSDPRCRAGNVALSPTAFNQIGQLSEGYLGTGNGGTFGQISWEFVPCPGTGRVHYRIEDPTNVTWNGILVEGHRNPISKVEVQVNGVWKLLARGSNNYFEGGMALPLPGRITDVFNNVVTGSFARASGDIQLSTQLSRCP